MYSHWCESPYGKFVLQQEAKMLQQSLLISASNCVALLCDERAVPVLTSKPLGPNQPNVFTAKFNETHLCTANNEQNIETGSVDWVILWHALEQQKDPQALLREVTRVLSDGGRVSIYGFNPMRSWSRKFWLWKDKSKCAISSELSQFRVHDWLSLLNYEVTQVNSFVAPNLSRIPKYRQKHEELQNVNTLPLLGMIYHFEAIRRHYPMTYLRINNGKEAKRSLQLISPGANSRVAKLVPVRPTKNKDTIA